MKETIECCGKPVEIDHERDIVVCRECGKILYKRITDYNRELLRTRLSERKREHEH